MKPLNLILATVLAFGPNAFAKGKIQNEDVKTLTEITYAGGTAAQLINDSKIYVTAQGINEQLSSAIENGRIGGAGAGGGVNLLATSNWDFEAGNTNWTASGGTFAIETTNPLFGAKSGSWDASASSQTLQSVLKTIDKGMVGRRCALEIAYKWP